MPVAITKKASREIGKAELTHLPRVKIDHDRVDQQHRQYERMLVDAGCDIDRLPADPRFPDSVFVEDTAVVLDEVAVMARPGVESRRGEIESVAAILGAYRKLCYIEAPATLDGGDVLRVGRRLYVREGGRTNSEGVAQLRRLVRPFDYEVVPVLLDGCLHLKSAATLISERMLLLNPDWVDASQFEGCVSVAVDPSEPSAANVLAVNGILICSDAYPMTLERLRARGLDVRALDISELAKAEGALTCCSLIFRRVP